MGKKFYKVVIRIKNNYLTWEKKESKHFTIAAGGSMSQTTTFEYPKFLSIIELLKREAIYIYIYINSITKLLENATALIVSIQKVTRQKILQFLRAMDEQKKDKFWVQKRWNEVRLSSNQYPNTNNTIDIRRKKEEEEEENRCILGIKDN